MQSIMAPSSQNLIVLWVDIWAKVKEARLRLQNLRPHERLTFEYDVPQRRAVLRLAEVNHAVIVPNADQTTEVQTPEGHWRLTVQKLSA